MYSVELQGMTIRFGHFTAVENVNIRIEEGEFFSFLGPSGCGKTTILRSISGFQEPTEGSVSIMGKDMKGTGPNRRPTALIFQNLALFPLMSVAENIGFGLEVRGVSKAKRGRKVEELLELIALPGQGNKKISELSGGQKQRVAIARALAVTPKVLLLDEPLSALDLKLRQHMRTELRAIQKRVGITFIYITHDQGEALTMSDRVAVMNHGVVSQIGTGKEIYDSPATSFVASFVGENNPVEGTIKEAEDDKAVIETPLGSFKARNINGLSAGQAAVLFIRPEIFGAFKNGENPDPIYDNLIETQIEQMEFEGSLIHFFLRGNPGRNLMMSLPNTIHNERFHAGETIRVGFRSARATIISPGEMSKDDE